MLEFKTKDTTTIATVKAGAKHELGSHRVGSALRISMPPYGGASPLNALLVLLLAAVVCQADSHYETSYA